MKYLIKSFILSVFLYTGVINSQEILPLNMFGTWQGKLPCADCEYISYRLRLDKDMSYKDQMVYHDKDVKPTITEGAWELKDNILTLSASGGGKMKFSVTSGKLILLDGEGNPVPNSDIIKLTRQLADDSGMLDRWYEKRNRGIDFIAGGNEPFWSVEIDIEKRTLSFNKIDFEAPLEFKDFDVTALADPNTKTFYGNTPKHNITVEITKAECIDNMSGEVSPYKVSISLRTGKSNKTDIYFGCGRFLADKQLTASWLIESINGKNIKDYNLTAGKVPVLELNAASERFSGTAGCNNFFGSFAAESNKIIFGKVASTLMLCADMSMEKDVFTLLNENEYLWSIENNMLILTDLSGNKVMVLRKGE